MLFTGAAQSIEIFNFGKSREAPKTIPLRWDFTTDTIVEVNMSQDRAMARFEQIRSIYFDCSNCANDVVFSCAVTQQTVIFKAGKQGYRNVLVSQGMTIRFTGVSGDVFKANLLNIDMPEAEWPLDTSIPGIIPLSSLVDATAQYDVIGRKSAGAGPWEDCTRTELNIPGLELANTFTDSITISRTSGVANLAIEGNGGVNNQITRYSSNVNSPNYTSRKAYGTIAAPLIVGTGAQAGTFITQLYDGSAFKSVGSLSFTCIAAVPSTTDLQTRFDIQITAAVASVQSVFLRGDWTNGMQIGTTGGYFLRADRGFVRRQYTFATLPAAAAVPSTYYEITDGAAAPAWMAAAAGGGAVVTPVHSNGAAWLNG